MIYSLFHNDNFVLALGLLAILGLVCLAGIIFALVRWKRHRLVSIITMVSLLLTVLSTVAVTISRFYLIETRTSRILGDDGANKFMELSLAYSHTFNLFFVIGSVIQILLLVFFIVAIFAGRGENIAEKQATGAAARGT